MKKLILVLTVVTLAAFLLVGCLPTANHAPVFTSTPDETAVVGVEYSYTPTATDADGDTVTFSVAGPTTMAISAGVITWTPTAVGSEAVIVTATDGTDPVTQSFTITVSAAPVVPVAVTSVTLDKTALALVVGGANGTLKETVLPATATDPSVIWASSAPAATVALGVVTPVTAGTAYITVTTVDGGFTAICAVTVSAAPVAVTSVTLDKATMTLTAAGTTGILVETVLPTDATDPSVTWASSAEAVAKVAGGVVTPLTAGTATITVTTVDGSKTATCVVTVVPKLLTSIVVLPETMTLTAVTDTKTITSVTAHYSDGTTAVITPLTKCTFKSSDGDVATAVDGVVKAVGYGEATITVSYREEDTTRTVYYVEESDTIVVTVGRVHNITANRYYATIATAITGAYPGDTIEVAAGTYAENVVINVEGLTLKSVEEHKAIIEGQITIAENGITIQDLQIEATGLASNTALALLADGVSDIRVKNNRLLAMSPVTVYSKPATVWLTNVDEVVFEGNYVDSVIEDVRDPFAVYVVVTADGSATVTNNDLLGALGVGLGENSTVDVLSNTIEDARKEGIWFWPVDVNGHIVVEGNTVEDYNCADVGAAALKIVSKPASVNGVTDETKMAKAILDANSDIDSVYLEWIPGTWLQ